MLKSRLKRRAALGGRAVDRLAEIEAAVAGLKDEDLRSVEEGAPHRQRGAAFRLYQRHLAW